MSGRVPVAGRLYALLLYSYPRSFRQAFGAQMVRAFTDALAARPERGVRVCLVWFWDAVASGVAERFAHARGSSSSRGLKPMHLFRDLPADLRHSIRHLRREPGFTSVVVLTLALSIGIGTTVFHALHALVLQPLPYPAAQQLVRLVMVDDNGRESGKVSAADARDWLEQATSIESVALVDYGTVALAGGAGDAEIVRSAHATQHIFDVLGVGPAPGRGFSADEMRPGAARVAVLSRGLWQRRFGADPTILGQTVHLNARPYTVIGVLPARFEAPEMSDAGAPDVWLPLDDGSVGTRGERWLDGIARLAPTARPEAAARELNVVAQRLSAAYPETNKDLSVRAVGLQKAIWSDFEAPLYLGLAAAIVVLLIACANVANLMLARGAARRTEFAVRAALGAGRFLLARQLLAESLLLGLLGGAGGVLWTLAITAVLRRAAEGQLPRLTETSIAPATIGIAALAALLASLLFGLLPALHTVRGAARDAVNLAGTRRTAGPRGRVLRKALVGLQVSLSLVLLVSAALLLRSFERVMQVDPGFEPAGALAWELTLPSASYTSTDRVLAYQRELLDRLAAIPGVTAAGAVDKPPFGTRWGCAAFTVDGRPLPATHADWPCSDTRSATTGYFAALGVPILRGRGLQDSDDENAALVAVVNQSFARQHFGAEDPIGKRIVWAQELDDAPRWRTIVGIARDLHHRGLTAPPLAEVYMPYRQTPDRRMTFVVRTQGNARAVTEQVRATVRSLDGMLAMRGLRPLDDVVRESMSARRAGAVGASAFAIFAALLAVVGLYGVVSYLVALRTPEIGVRMAMGADRRDILLLVLGDGLRTTVIALAAGLLGAAATSRLLSGLLFQVEANDLTVFAAATTLLLTVSVLATLLPASRAARLHPARLLRRD